MPDYLKSEFELALFREYFTNTSSSGLRYIPELCNEIARLNGWDLDSCKEKVLLHMQELELKRQEELAKENKTREEIATAKSRKNFIKKHGRAPPNN